ncbi:hypothetical protein [Marinomonas sp. 2405UD68-3]|uniref:hypothetical protein n=1 Tax=Marinomonas sp. 2405UD68-3 TaxID=3391835 RepID=UPI0039C9AD3E
MSPVVHLRNYNFQIADDEQEIINHLKVALPIAWYLVEKSLRLDSSLVTDGSEPEWGVLKDWHGLRIGEHWNLAESDTKG